MIQLQILDGKLAGRVWVARQFPVRVGRTRHAHVCLEEPGVWNDHLELRFDPQRGIIAFARPEAPVRINDEPVQEAVLRNGDVLQVGGVRLRFGLSEVRPRLFRVREALVWGALVLVTAAQIALFYGLTR